jgi:uncharacterized protein with PIN domain
MKFIVDAMLGKLAKWLRILGYDVLYSNKYSDWQILRRAEKEGRVIVTRDKTLYRRAIKKGLTAILTPYGEDADLVDALAAVALSTGISLDFDPSRTRCPICNVRLERISKAEALSYVPKDIWSKYDEFWRCPKCGKIYWRGRHWKTITDKLERAKELVRAAIVDGGSFTGGSKSRRRSVPGKAGQESS